MSAIGPKRTFGFASHMSAFGGKADMASAMRNVRFVARSGHRFRVIRVGVAASGKSRCLALISLNRKSVELALLAIDGLRNWPILEWRF
jgi:hypothetical protein